MRLVVTTVLAVLLVLVVQPAVAGAQSPTDPAHPALPWGLGVATPQGQLIRYLPYLPGQYVRDIWIPAQPVVVEEMVALPPSAEPGRTAQTADADSQAKAEPQYGVLRHTFTVPGYYVRETTAGFHYPERWMLDQSYMWRLLPAQFVPRSTVGTVGLPPAR